MALSKYGNDDQKDQSRRYIRPLRTFLWVALISLLIWVYADMEFTETQEFRVTLRLNADAAPDLVLTPPTEYSVEFAVRGNRHSIDRLKMALQQRNFAISHDVSGQAAIPTFTLSLADALYEALDLTRKGLSIVSAAPQTVTIHTDEMTTVRDVPIEFSYTGGRVRNVEVNPSSTDIRVAAGKWQQVLQDLEARDREPVLRTRQVDLRQLEDDSISVPVLGTINGTDVSPEAETVRVSFEIVQIKETHDFEVPVQVLSPPAWSHDGTWEDYVLERRDPVEWRKTITIAGPREHLDVLRQRPRDVQAYITLTEEDKRPIDSWDRREVTIRLPAELDMEVVGPAPTVWFRLIRHHRAVPSD